jgi:hypothetical protein
VKASVVTRRRESRRRQTKGSKEEMGRWREKEAEDISNELRGGAQGGRKNETFPTKRPL